ncbi:MAG TPA: hypothetical protein PLN32_01690 [Methanoregulaceae archaeon]|nr:hypothetical protein [Methanoregulaceae archaeon]
MIAKKTMIQELGEDELILPTLVNNALAANDRIKYFFTLLQAARLHAMHPGRETSNLKAEREAAGVDDPVFDRVVTDSVMVGKDTLQIPYAPLILSGIRSSLAEMAAPLPVYDEGKGEFFQKRVALLAEGIPSGENNLIADEVIQRITAGDEGTIDSIHLLVMDIHKELIVLQGDLASEVIDGAMAYLLHDEDRDLVAAFMAGLKRTSPLRFDHPGLGTTATRSRGTLVIQNDIGMTDAHVLVVNVEEPTVTVIYTDIHMPRLQFFQALFDEQGMTWEDTLSKNSGDQFEAKIYHLSVGTYRAGSREDLERFLKFLGSRLVFLIDWNRARKRLRTFLQNRDASAVLKWAADNEYGHMAFLLLGGEKIIYEALELASRVPLRYGEPLHQILGRERTVEYFKWVLKTASTGLRAGHSRLLLQDEIKAELLRYFRTAHENLMEICEEHATLTIDVAMVLRDSLIVIIRGEDGDYLTRNAMRAKRLESEADALVIKVRSLSRRIETATFYADLINVTDDALDFLEEAMFLSTLIPRVTSSKKLTGEMVDLAEIAVKSSQEFLKALMASQNIHRGYTRDDMQDFLQAVDRVIGYERECDEALRQSEKSILTQSTDYREMMIFFEIARTIEESTNSLMKAVYGIRDRILEGMNR